MAKREERSKLVTLQGQAMSNADKVAALVTVLERKGILTQREVLEEIQR